MLSRVVDRGAGVAGHAAAAACAAAAAWVLVAATHSPRSVLAGLGIALVGIAIVCIPAVAFPAAAVVVVGTFQLSDDHPLQLQSISVYSTDLLLLAVLARAFLPRPRRPTIRAFRGLSLGALVAWAIVFAWASARGHAAGTSFDTTIRLGMSLYYLPLFCFGFSRIAREQSFRFGPAIHLLALTACGFIVFMLAMRAWGHHFEQTNHLGRVVIAGDEELRRDYGLSSAFIIYPALGVCAAAYAVFARATRIALWLAVAGIGATLLTLIRGEIFGLGLGLLVLLIIRSRTRRARRVATIASITAAFALFFVVLTVNDPLLARGIAERSLPGLTAQSAYANSTADYRLDALRSGLAAARARPAGSGFISPDAVAGLGTDPGYLGHSSPAWLLFYAGWPGLLSGIAAALAVLVVGLRAPASRDWIRPAFVATWLMLVVSSLSADALVGQPWVVMLAALTLALRFAAQQEPTKL